MRVVVARPLTGDVHSDVGKTGVVVGGATRGWIHVLLDGEATWVPFRATELEPLRASQSDERG